MYDENQVYDNTLHSHAKISWDSDDNGWEEYHFQNNLTQKKEVFIPWFAVIEIVLVWKFTLSP